MRSPEPDDPRRARSVTIPVAAAAALVVLGFIFRIPCVRAGGELKESLERLCYTDVYALYYSEGLHEGVVPYFDVREDGRYMEYPVLTGAWMYAMAKLAPKANVNAYFWLTQVAFGLLIVGGAAALARLVGWRRALYFAAAPTLLLLGGISWDLLAVVPMCLALLAFSAGRDGTAGLLLGIGAAAKLYPAFALPFLALQRLREGRKRAAAMLAVVSGLTILAVNLPVAVGAPRGWREFFRLNAERGADWDSIWHHIDRVWHIGIPTLELNRNTALLFVAGFALLGLWQWLGLRSPDDVDAAPGIRRSTASAMFILVAWFLMVNKVWSPQYGVWLLPLWALILPATGRAVGVWIAFQALDVFVLVTRFWSPEFAGLLSHTWFSAAIFARFLAFGVLLLVLLTLHRARRAEAPA